MNALTVLASSVGVTAALNVLGALTKSADDYIRRTHPEELPLPPEQEDSAEPVQPPPEPATPKRRAVWWWQQLLTLEGVLGLLLLPVQPVILLINSYLIALTLEIILYNPGPPLLVLNIWGWERPVTIFDAIGVLVSLGQMVAASVYRFKFDGSPWPIHFSAPIALLAFIVFEVSAAFLRGQRLEGLENALLSAVLALGTAALEVRVGVLVIDHFLVPLLAAIGSSLSAPFWAVLGWWERHRPRRRRRYWVRQRGNPILRGLAWPLAMIDRSLMEPLRRFDDGVATLIFRKFNHSHPEGGTYEQERLSTNNKYGTGSGHHGNGPAGVQQDGAGSATPDAATGMDPRVGYHNLNL